MRFRRSRRKDGQEGFALIIAIFVILLLSAIGLGMMYSSMMETKVNSNFRDKQIAVYAAQSGALEARARLQPLNGDIGSTAMPTSIPASGAHSVYYIINPGVGETAADIKPWDYTNKYHDTELCQEGVLGLSGTVGVACSGSSSLPSPTDTGWYTTFTAGTPSQLSNLPISYKWARISLKTNNMTSVAANGDSTVATQVCYDGLHQYVIPAGASADCSPSGKVTAVNITNFGSGYTSAPTVTLSGGGGTGATAVAHLNSSSTGQVTSITITNDGHSYTAAPIVTLVSNDGGSGATAVATINPPGSGPVNSLTLNSIGSPVGCYAANTPPSVAFSGGGGTGAAATAVLSSNANCVLTFGVTGSCSNHKGDLDTVTIPSGNGGSGFSATFRYQDTNQTGSGYVIPPITITNPGSGYTFNPATSSPYRSALGCSLTPTYTLGYTVQSLTLTSGGTGYTSAPTVSFGPGPAGGSPTATAGISGGANAGHIVSIVITNPGADYTVAPTVQITNAPGDTTGGGGTAVAALTPGMTIEITNGGTGYTSAPTVTLSGGGGTGATATAVIGGGSYNGQVFMVTSMAQAPGGSRAMTQMEVATLPRGLLLPGALTLDGPAQPAGSSNPLYGVPNSHQLQVNGTDANTCGEAVTTPPTYPSKPAIGVYDDPSNPTPTSALNQVTSAINAAGRQDNYTGSGSNYPDVENAYSSLGDTMTTPSGMDSIVATVATTPGAITYGNNPSNIVLGTAAAPTVDIVNGNLTLSGNQKGYGILVVTGTLNFSGDFSWNGLILVIGAGVCNSSGGGNGQIYGSMVIARTRSCPATGTCTRDNTLYPLLSSLGSPSMNWNGGGTNGIHYDHCWADKMLAKIPKTIQPSGSALKILSQRTVTY